MSHTQYIFADFLVDADEEILYKAGAPIKLQIRSFQVLRLLLENAGSVVTKEDFFEQVWRGTFVEDNNLTVAVTQIRKVLGEIPDNRFIETVPKKGYRFVADVEKVVGENAKPEFEILSAASVIVRGNSVSEDSENPARKISNSHISRKVFGFALLVLVVFSIGAFWHNRAKSKPTSNAEAYESYLQGQQELTKSSTKDLEKAINNFTAAAVKDPLFADAHAALATAHIKHGLALYAARGLSASRRSFPLAKESAVKTLELKSDSDEALAALAFVNWRYEYDWQKAEANFRKALKINSNNVQARRWLGEFLHRAGRFDEGFAEQQKALALEPDSALILGEIAWGNYLAHRFEEAENYSKKSLYADKTHASTLYNLSEISEQKGNLKEAVELWKEAMMADSAARRWIANIEQKHQTGGRQGFVQAKVEWLEDLIEKDYVYPTDLAKCYAVLGENDKAINWLEKGIEAKVPDLLSIKYAPAFDSLKTDARFQKILERMNFPKQN